MTEAGKATGKAGGLATALPTDAMKDAGQRLLGLLVERAAQVATDKVGDLSDRLTGVAENGGTGLVSAFRSAPDTGDGEDRDDGGPSRIGSAFGSLKEKLKGALGGGGRGGSGKKLKVTVINESRDVGLPLRTTYDLWTQFGDFPSFMKKVETVDQESDEKLNWKAQIFLSHRTWEATIVEQVPDSHIVWKSKGAKGHVDGSVIFTELGRNLTRVILVLEYWPKGLFEQTGNLWRAQGRRARLEFQHFRRHAMTSAILRQEEIEGWRGEIRDSQVVKTHEEALEEEERAREESLGDEEDTGQDVDQDEAAAAEAGEDSDEDEYSDEDADAGDDEYADDKYADDEVADDEVADDEVADDEVADDEYDDDEPEAASAARDRDADRKNGRSRARKPVAAQSRRGR